MRVDGLRAVLAAALLAPLLALAQGQVQHLSGTMSVQRADGSVRLLSEKSQVQVGDVLTTEDGTYAQLDIADGGKITLRPNTQIRIDGFEFSRAEAEKSSFAYSLVKGGLRAVSGLIGKENPEGYQLRTETGTIGIRGTDFNALHIPRPGPGGGPPADQPRPGVYVVVAEGLVVMLAGGVERVAAPGQALYSSDANRPPSIVPVPAGLPAIDPPASFRSGNPTAVNGGQGDACTI